MTTDLNKLPKKDLTDKAKKLSIPNAATLSKEDLIKAILKLSKKKEKPAPKPVATTVKAKEIPPVKAAKPSVNGHPSKTKAPPAIANGHPVKKVQKSAAREGEVSASHEAAKSKFEMGVPSRDLASRIQKTLPNGYSKDRIVVMVRDPYWLHVYWELTHQSVQRAEAALGQDWHGAKPILRICDVTAQDTTSTAEAIVKDIYIHGGCNNWYVEVPQPPKSYRIDIGYISKRGQLYVLARSNVVTTPKAGSSDAVDENWSELDTKNADRIMNMSMGGNFDLTGNMLGMQPELKTLLEERLRKPLSSPTLSSYSSSSHGAKDRKFFFSLDAELIVYGRTEPTAHVTLQGEPIKLRPDGTFTMRYSLPDSRQIIPAIAASSDGVEERTIVLAVERNTKQLEPLIHDGNTEL
ncbi:DUF4912 domain-containing protein [Telmatocola sphagniphila]|uniref:DUF4912 domain-containing protein n=1 Tax=Telmatocola sphagniphila TaxID=1123043 RepID=A0A8E6B5Q2_9BACT|nr:DUF4912 domain-containing protein [Telmatocola sphagniphila]QVL30993.1 DUF4912 domain-containing protein [Telmatocola sphagniphila]